MRRETIALPCPNCDPNYAGVQVRVQGFSWFDLEAEYVEKECSCELTPGQIGRLEQQALDEALDPR